MSKRDHYYNKAKQEGYRARSAYKLKQLDEAAGLLSPGDTVVDLGAAPGGWLQVAAEAVGEGGTVIGVDRQRIDPLEETHGASVEYVRGDMTDAETRDRVREVAGGDVDGGGNHDEASGEIDETSGEIDEACGEIDEASGDVNDSMGSVDVVLSDMAPNMTGEYSVDHARSVHLARQAYETAKAVLAGGGDLAVKVFDGQDLDALRSDIERDFEYVRTTTPEASRDSSSEVYLLGKRFLTAPVRAGEELTVEIVDVGSEGDGVAKVEGYTLFVPDTEAGETVDVRVTEIKARFGFAEKLSE